jgi:hypothetical protein
MIILAFFHPGDLELSDWLWMLLYCFFITLPFVLGGLGIIYFFKRRNAEK